MYLDKKYILAEVPEFLCDEVVSWCYDQVRDNEIYTDGDMYGRVHNIHLTLLTDVQENNLKCIEDSITDIKCFVCYLGEIRKFTTNSKFDVLYIDVKSPEVIEINKKLSSNIKNSSFYSVYIPHVTICYLEKNAGESFVGNSFFKDKYFNVEDVLFSTPEQQSKFMLGRKK